jgi:hypothetical protein
MHWPLIAARDPHAGHWAIFARLTASANRSTECSRSVRKRWLFFSFTPLLGTLR